MIAIGAATFAALMVARRAPRRGLDTFLLVSAAWWWPRLTIPVIAGMELLRRARRLRRIRHAALEADRELLLLSQSVGIGLRAGLAPIAALQRAALLLTSDLAAEVEGVLRQGALVGAGPALSAGEGRAGALFRMIGRAVQTGSPLAAAVDAATAEIVRDRLATRLTTIRKLPVRLMVPLTLCILPGFVLMTLGPVIDQAVKQFSL
ncbi:MAG: hypothetical protein HKO10_01675 [Acidimicrobiia bacterium]|nr:hypothetical protein [Acidimicrobiia bacterium]